MTIIHVEKVMCWWSDNQGLCYKSSVQSAATCLTHTNAAFSSSVTHGVSLPEAEAVMVNILYKTLYRTLLDCCRNVQEDE